MVKKLFKYFFSSVLIITVVITLFLVSGGFMPGRKLTDNEIALVKDYYSENLDLSKVRIVRNSVYSTFSAVTLGNRIHINTSKEKDKIFEDLSRNLEGQYLLIHELEHVYQFQNEGWGYVPKSLYAQFIAQQTTGSRNGAYNWYEKINTKIPWNQWNPEEQAEAISDYYLYRIVGFDVSEKGRKAKELGCFIPQLKKKFC